MYRCTLNSAMNNAVQWNSASSEQCSGVKQCKFRTRQWSEAVQCFLLIGSRVFGRARPVLGPPIPSFSLSLILQITSKEPEFKSNLPFLCLELPLDIGLYAPFLNSECAHFFSMITHSNEKVYRLILIEIKYSLTLFCRKGGTRVDKIWSDNLW